MGATHVDSGKEIQPVEICEESLKGKRENRDQIILNIVNGNESWSHHFDPEEKRLSMEYRHTISPRTKNSKQFQLPA